MAGPKKHTIASAELMVLYVIGSLVGFTRSWEDLIWIAVFSVLIDIDHIPFGRLWRAFKTAGIDGVLASWKKDGWLDADHLNIMHTWWALIAVIIFSFAIGNVWPLVAFAIHTMIDAGSLDQQDYPKCSPMPGWIFRHFAIRYYPEWTLYHTRGLPMPKK